MTKENNEKLDQKLVQLENQKSFEIEKVIDELKRGIVTIGESNGKQMQVNQDLLRTIDRRTEEISRKLDELRGGRGQLYTPPANFTETDEQT